MTSIADPARLDHAGIAARIPHGGAMCLLDTLRSWSADTIRCTATSHRDAAHPLRSAGRLHAAVAVEYASQAMALHGSLCAAAGATPQAGFLAGVRGVRLRVPRLDDIDGPITITARRQAGDAGQAIYAFMLHDAQGRLLVDGRATVILNSLP